MDELRALVAKWRTQAANGRALRRQGHDDIVEATPIYVFEACADELEAALAASSKAKGAGRLTAEQVFAAFNPGDAEHCPRVGKPSRQYWETKADRLNTALAATPKPQGAGEKAEEEDLDTPR